LLAQPEEVKPQVVQERASLHLQQLEERDPNIKEEFRQLAQSLDRSREEEAVVILEVVPALLQLTIWEAEVGDPATLVAAFLLHLLIPLQAHLALLLAKPKRQIWPTRRIIKASR